MPKVKNNGDANIDEAAMESFLYVNGEAVLPIVGLEVAQDPLFQAKHITTWLNFIAMSDKNFPNKEWVQGNGNASERYYYCTSNYDNKAKRDKLLKQDSHQMLPGKLTTLF